MNTARQLLPGVPWFDIPDPASPDLDELAQRFHLHELQIEDTRHRPQRAKVDEYGSYLFAVLKHLHPGDKPMFDDFDVFLGSNFLVTVHQGDAPLLAKLVQRVQENHVERLDRILYLLMDLIVDEYLTHLDNSAEDIAKIETEVLERPEPQVLREIFRLKRRLIDFRRIAAGMRDVVNAIIRREGGLVGDDLDPYFRDIYDHLVRRRGLGRSPSRPADRLPRYLSFRRRQSHQRSREGADHLRHPGAAAGNYHRLLGNEPALAVERQSEWGVVRVGIDGIVDRAGAFVFQVEALVLN